MEKCEPKLSYKFSAPLTSLSWHSARAFLSPTVQMCDLMWGWWECINNHHEISVGHARSFAVEGKK